MTRRTLVLAALAMAAGAAVAETAVAETAGAETAGAEADRARDARASEVVVRPATPGAEIVTDLTVTVQGQAVPLEKHVVFRDDNPAGYRLESARARFAVGGPVCCRVSTAAGSLESARLLSSAARRDLAVVDGNAVDVDLAGPGTWVVKLRRADEAERTVFLWVDDRRIRAPDAEDPAVIIATEHGVVPDPETGQTVALQGLLDRCAARDGGGTLVLPAGVYRSGTLRIGSHTTLWLAPGALLRGVDDPDAFPPHPDGNRRLLFIENAEDVMLAGFGVVDGNGTLLRNELGLRVQDVDVTSSRDVRIRDLLFRNAGSWCLHLLHSDDVRVSDVKVLSDHDAIDPDACRDVAIERLFAQSGDDAVAVKVTSNSGLTRSCERIAVTDCLLSTIKTGLKCGTENRAPIRDVRFERCTLFDTSRGIAVWASDGFDVERVAWRDIRMELVPVPGEDKSGEAFRFHIRERRGLGVLRDCVVEDVVANAFHWSPLYGHPDARLGGLVLRDIVLHAEQPRHTADPVPVFYTGNIDDVVVDGLTIHWNGHRDEWAGLTGPEDAAGLTMRDLSEIP